MNTYSKPIHPFLLRIQICYVLLNMDNFEIHPGVKMNTQSESLRG